MLGFLLLPSLGRESSSDEGQVAASTEVLDHTHRQMKSENITKHQNLDQKRSEGLQRLAETSKVLPWRLAELSQDLAGTVQDAIDVGDYELGL